MLQFAVVIGSVAFLLLAIWLIARYVRVARNDQPKIRHQDPADARIEAIDPQLPSEPGREDGVELILMDSQAEADRCESTEDDADSQYENPSQFFENEEFHEYRDDSLELHETDASGPEPHNYAVYEIEEGRELHSVLDTGDHDALHLAEDEQLPQSDWRPGMVEPQIIAAAAETADQITSKQPDMDVVPHQNQLEYEQGRIDIPVEFPDYSGSSDIAIDAVAWLPQSRGGTKRTRLVPILRNLGLNTKHPYFVYGQSLEDGKWYQVMEDSSSQLYSGIVFALQLVHHGQPVAEQDWWQFKHGVESTAKSLKRRVEWSDTVSNVLQSALELCARTENLDIKAILVVQLHEDAALSDKSVEYLVNEFGLVKHDDSSTYSYFGANSEHDQASNAIRFIPMQKLDIDLLQLYQPFFDRRNILLECNLPTVENPSAAFRSMTEFGMELADLLNGQLLDQDFNRVDAASISHLQAFVDEYVQWLSDANITPGGDVALRLFDFDKLATEPAEEKKQTLLDTEQS